jgi:hypothetical protein
MPFSQDHCISSHARRTRSQWQSMISVECRRCASTAKRFTGKKNVSRNQQRPTYSSEPAAILGVSTFLPSIHRLTRFATSLRDKALPPRNFEAISDNTTIPSPSPPWVFRGAESSRVVAAPTPFEFKASFVIGPALSYPVKERNPCSRNFTSMTPQPPTKLDVAAMTISTPLHYRPSRTRYGSHTHMPPSIVMPTNAFPRAIPPTCLSGFTALGINAVTTCRLQTRLRSSFPETKTLMLLVHATSFSTDEPMPTLE